MFLDNKKVVIFDLDGTLIDSVGIWNAIDIELIKEISNVVVDDIAISNQRKEILKEFSKSEDAYLNYCGYLGQKYGSTLSKEEIKKRRYEIASEYLKNRVDYKPYAEEVIKYLKEKGYILVIASTTNDFTIDVYKKQNQNIISKASFEDYFTLVYSKGAVKELKPNPEIYYKIISELNVKKVECIIVEDALIGVEAANNAGIDCAVIYDKYSDCDREEINKLSKYQFSDFKVMLDEIKNV